MRKVLLVLLLLIGSTAAMGQWSDNPEENNRLTPKDMTIYSSDFKVTPDGITYYVYYRPLNGYIATCLQIVDKEGKMLFPEEGKIISNKVTRSFTVVNDMIMIDRDNNALIAVHDSRNSNEEVQSLSYSIYKVSPTGEMLWGEEGIDIEEGYAYEIEAALRMMQREDGSYVFAWMKNNGDMMGIKLQNVSPDGELLWDNVEIREDAVSYEYPFLVSAGNNQVNLVYAKGTNKEIMARKIDFDGSSVWPEDTRIYRAGFPNIPLQVILKVVAGPDGGVIVGWYDDRAFTQKESTFISYVKPNGTLAFASGDQGERVGYSENRSFSPEMRYDQTEKCIYVVWRETNGNQSLRGIMAQKVSLTGELLWGSEGIEVVPLSDTNAANYSIQEADLGECAIFYTLTYSAYGDVKAFANRFAKDGTPVWESPTVLATCVSQKSNLKSSQLINGSYWLTSWADNRKFTTDEKEKSVEKIYMQKVNMDGTLSASSIQPAKTSAEASFSIYPSLIEETSLFRFENEEAGMVDISVYNVSGQKVAVPYHTHTDKGSHEVILDINKNRLGRGAYIATLTTAYDSQSVRIIVK